MFIRAPEVNLEGIYDYDMRATALSAIVPNISIILANFLLITQFVASQQRAEMTSKLYEMVNVDENIWASTSVDSHRPLKQVAFL